jgi:NAD(P)-dependent dehydrogenase (short-subunit alcohol dehydrogenase family)
MTDAAARTRSLAGGLEGRRVAITAGAGGIGLAIAEVLASHGARIAICDIAEDQLEAARKALKPALAMRADVSRETDVDAFFAAIAQELGGLDALVNNAGIAGPTGAVDEISLADWQRCIDVCLTGQFLCARRAVPMLKAAGGGSIVGISSIAGKLGYAYRSPYAAAKFGVVGFCQTLAKELGPVNIRVNAVLPGIIEGPRIEQVIAARARQANVSHEDMKARYLSNVSLKRMTSPYDIAAMVAFLVSDAGFNISGQALSVDASMENL